jgi:hypothetical protein
MGVTVPYHRTAPYSTVAYSVFVCKKKKLEANPPRDGQTVNSPIDHLPGTKAGVVPCLSTCPSLCWLEPRVSCYNREVYSARLAQRKSRLAFNFRVGISAALWDGVYSFLKGKIVESIYPGGQDTGGFITPPGGIHNNTKMH